MWCCCSFLSILINGLALLRGMLTILEFQKHSPLPALCNSNDIAPLMMRIHHPSQHDCPCSGGLTQWYESWVVVSTSGSVGPSLCLWCRKQPPWETEAVGIGSKKCTSVWVGMTAPLLCLSVASQMLFFWRGKPPRPIDHWLNIYCTLQDTIPTLKVLAPHWYHN